MNFVMCMPIPLHIEFNFPNASLYSIRTHLRPRPHVRATAVANKGSTRRSHKSAEKKNNFNLFERKYFTDQSTRVQCRCLYEILLIAKIKAIRLTAGVATSIVFKATRGGVRRKSGRAEPVPAGLHCDLVGHPTMLPGGLYKVMPIASPLFMHYRYQNRIILLSHWLCIMLDNSICTSKVFDALLKVAIQVLRKRIPLGPIFTVRNPRS